MPPPLFVIAVSRRAEERLGAGHLWVFGDDLRDLPQRAFSGEFVSVVSRSGRPLGTGTLNTGSRIALRLLSRGEVFPTRGFIAGRIAEAVSRRAADGIAGDEAFRVVNSEGDFLPGLTVDRYGSMLVVQFTTAGMERLREEIFDVLWTRFSPRIIVERSEGWGRRQEGLPEKKGVVRGEGEPVEEVTVDGIRFVIDAIAGPKTGFFLDQRRNRQIVRARAAGKRVLDAFCSVGAFGLYALAGGASSVVAVDASEWAIRQARENAARNGFADRWEGRPADLFQEMRDMAGRDERFDLVVIDPPSFAKNREGREGALRGYRDINRLGLSILDRGGFLATSSCTQLVDTEMWTGAIRDAASSVGADLERVETGEHSLDHPVLLGVPETDYLKFALYRRRSS